MPQRSRSRSRTPGYAVGFPMAASGVLTSLDFDFQNGRYYQSGQGVDPLVLTTTSRASTAYADNLAGVWSAFLSNVPRITNKGLLVEEARTNSIRNNSMQGVVAGSPGTLPTNWVVLTTSGGITQTIIGGGTESGIDYIDIRWAGTSLNVTATSRAFEANTQIAAAVGQVWTSSVFVTLIGGSTTNTGGVVLRIRERDAGGTSIDTGSGPAITLVAGILGSNRHSLTRTLAQATTAFAIPEIAFAPSGTGLAIDLTLRIGWPQLELGAFATSPIRTTTAAATRAADVVTVTTPPVFGNAYTMFGKGQSIPPTTYAGAGTQPMTLINVSDGSELNRVRVQRTNSSGTPPRMQTTVANVSTTTVDAASWAANTSGKIAAAFAAGDQALSFNGGTVDAAAASAIPAPTVINIGTQNDGGHSMKGYIERVALWPNTRLSNSDLQRITA